MQAVYQPTDLAALTADLASAFRSAIERAGMTLVVDCPPLDEPAYVDRDMWEKIVLNLVSNAFKYTLDRRSRASRCGGDGSSIVLTVADTGVGIPESELPHVFERFHRVEGIQGRTHEGTGIGLALVQELAKLHGGSVSVASQPGAGSTFTVTIPAGVAHLPADRISSRSALHRDDARRDALRRRGAAMAAGGRAGMAPYGATSSTRPTSGAAERSRRKARVAPVCSSPTTTPTCVTTSSRCWARSTTSKRCRWIWRRSPPRGAAVPISFSPT